MSVKAEIFRGYCVVSKKIKGADGQTYKMVSPSNNEVRKRTIEIVLSVVSMIVSVISLASGFGAAAFVDAFGGGGIYTGKLVLGILLSVLAFSFAFFLNKKHTLFSWAIIVVGIILLLLCGDFGIAGGIMFIITGIIALIRK